MTKRSSKPRDLNSMATAVVAQSTTDVPEADPYGGKDPAAVELGRREARGVAQREPQV